MKKRLSILLAVVLVLSMSSVALATVPSKTTADLVKVIGVASSTGAALPVKVTIPTPEKSTVANDELMAIVTYTKQSGTSLVSYFGQVVQDEIKALMPEGFGLDKLTMNEFLPLTLVDYKPEYSDLVCSFTFATVYTDGQPIVAMIGIKNESTVTWFVQKAEVVNGMVSISFTQDVLTKIQDAKGDFVLAILSEASL